MTATITKKQIYETVAIPQFHPMPSYCVLGVV
jgi:hypothetical protein